jgi:hypothetical protein
MKLRINEDQYNLLQNYQKRSNVSEYLTQMKEITKVVNAYYGKLTFATIAEIISGEINLNRIEDDLFNLDSKLRKINELAYDYINKLEDDEYEEGTDLKIDDMYGYVATKIRKLEDLVGNLDTVAKMEIDGEFSKYFKDVTPKEI